MAWNGLYGSPGYEGRGAEKTETKKRERHTFNASELAHVWAHEGATWGNRSDRRMYFEADPATYGRAERISTIYSYGSHFPIASLYHVKGQRVILFTTENYSTSTGKHKSEVRHAISHLPVHYVEHPRQPERAEESFKRAMDKALARARNPRVRNISYELSTIRETVEHGNAFAKQFGFKWRLKMPRDFAALQERSHALAERRRELDATEDARRAVRKAAELVSSICEWRNKPELLTPRFVAQGGRGYTGRHTALDYRRSPEWTADDAAELARRSANKVAIWRAYGGRASHLPGTLLRVVDGAHCDASTRELAGEIETSQGARFPLEHGVKALPLIRRIVQHQVSEGNIRAINAMEGLETPELVNLVLYQRNGHTIHLGHYAIDRIERRPDGVHVIAGCHDVPLAEVEHVAGELGL